jgi:hypothetical protein
MSQSIYRLEIAPFGEQRFVLDSAAGDFTKEDLAKVLVDLDRNGSYIFDLPAGGFIAVLRDQIRTILLVPVELLAAAQEQPVDPA